MGRTPDEPGNSRRNGDDKTSLETYRKDSLEWVLLTGNRGIIALGFAVAFAVFFTTLGSLGFVPLEDTRSLFYAYGGLIAGNPTLITVIVSINQLLLSRELQSSAEVRNQIESVIEYRNEIEDATNEIAPVKPLGFLRLLVEATREETQRLGGFTKDGVVMTGHEEIEDVVASLMAQMDEIDILLVEAETGNV